MRGLTGALWCCVVQTQPGTFQMGKPAAHHAQGWYTKSLSLSNRTPGCWILNVLFEHHLLQPTYEEVSPAGRQALCPRLNKMDLGWDERNQRCWVKPAVSKLSLQCQYWVRVHWQPRMVTAVIATPASTDTSPAIGRSKSWKRTPRWPALGKMVFNGILAQKSRSNLPEPMTSFF